MRVHAFHKIQVGTVVTMLCVLGGWYFAHKPLPQILPQTVAAEQGGEEELNQLLKARYQTARNLLELEEKRRLRREEAAARLHALADALASNNEVEFERGDLRFTVHVPDEVDFKLEIEIGDEEREIEIELTW